MMKPIPLPVEGAIVPSRPLVSVRRQTNADLDQFSLAELWHILKRRQRSILVSMFIFTLLALAASLYMTTKYEGVAIMEVNKATSDTLGLSSLDRFGSGAAADSLEQMVTLETEATALQSPSLALEVVQQLGLEKRKEFSLQPEGAAGWLTSWFGDKGEINAELKKPLEDAPLRRQRILKTFDRNLKIKPVAGTRLIEVHFLSPDPQVAADVPNRLVKDLQEQDFRTRFAATAQVSDWLSRQLADLKSEIADSQEKLNQAQKEAGILGSDEANNVVTIKLDALNRQLTEAEANRIIKQAVYELAKSGNPETISSIAGTSMVSGGAVNPNSLALLDTLRGEESQLKVQYAQASAKFGSAYPLLGQLQKQLSQLDDSIHAEITTLATRAQNDYLAAKKSENMLRSSFESQKAEANRLNDKAIQYTILKREVESSRTLYDDLLTKLKEGGLLSGLHSTNIVVLDPARTAAEPARPIYWLNLGLGMLVGLFGGIGFAFVRDSLDNTLRTPADVEATVALPCIGIVPELASCTNLPRRLRHNNLSVIDSSNSMFPSPLLDESYRALRTWLLHSDAGVPPRVITVTSALPREGKTTTSLNTAIALARDGSKVLLLEADLRRPCFQQLITPHSSSGLIGFLTNPDGCKAEFIEHPHVPNLFVLPAGSAKASPAELLGSLRMKKFVEFVRGKFDFVVIDTPPVLSFTDAAILSRHADAVLFVIRSEQTTKQSCLRARDVMERSNVRISGILVNGVNVNSADYQHYYGYAVAQYKHYYDGVPTEKAMKLSSGGVQ
jgi:polysaccharide biosynthesis transport protein